MAGQQDTTGSDTGSPHASGYVVVARRYRPQTFDDLVGQQTVAQALSNALRTDRVGHAYLFTGARGVGKTSTARILAKSLNCIEGPTATPCGRCDRCQQIASGDDIDVLEIDGASNRGIDEIRQLRSNVGVRPSRSRFKVYIIDEVHMLTREAFNALLKTLEEPPEHVKFVFCTTEPTKIPITVLSRCQRFDFSPVKPSEIVARLRFIVQQEGAEADDESLKLLARRAAGSLRDSQSLLEQLLSFVSEPITVDHVHAMLGTADDRRLRAILEAVNDRNAALAIERVDQALQEGVDVGQLAEQLVICLRDMMVALVGGEGELLLSHSPGELQTLERFAETWGMQNLLAAAQILDQTVARMRYSVHGRVLLELALIRVAQLEDLDSIAQLVETLRRQEGSAELSEAWSRKKKATTVGSRLIESAPAASQPRESRSEAQAAPLPNLAGQSNELGGDPGPLKKTATYRESPQGVADPPSKDLSGAAHMERSSVEDEASSVHSPLDQDEVARIWRSAIASLNDMTADSASLAHRVAISGPNCLVVQFQQVYNASKSFCERADRKQALEQAVAEAAGRPLRLEFEVVRDDAAHSVPRGPASSPQWQRQQVTRHPFVEKALEMFDGEVMKVDVRQGTSSTKGARP